MKAPTIADKKVTRYILQRFGLHMSKRLGTYEQTLRTEFFNRCGYSTGNC